MAMRIKLALVLMLAASVAFAQHRQLKIYVVEGPSEAKLADIIQELGRSCPAATATADQSAADYSLRVAHSDVPQGGLAGLVLAKPYTYILYSSAGDVMATKSVRTISKAVHDVCGIIGAAAPKKK